MYFTQNGINVHDTAALYVGLLFIKKGSQTECGDVFFHRHALFVSSHDFTTFIGLNWTVSGVQFPLVHGNSQQSVHDWLLDFRR